MNEVQELKVLNDYRLWLKFSDGEEKLVCLKQFLGKGFTAELLEQEKFAEVFIEAGGGIAWKNGYDFCPNFLRELADDGAVVL